VTDATGNKVPAEGSIWRIYGTRDTAAEALAGKLENVVKVTKVSGDIWRLYFHPGTTPTDLGMANMLQVQAAEVVAEPDHIALVTPNTGGEA